MLRFKAAGVTHVFFTGLASTLLFGPLAQQQNYHPRYVITTMNGPSSLMVGNVPKAQLAGAAGLGWNPYDDVRLAQDPGAVSPAASQCLKSIRDGGITVASRTAQTTASGYCEGLNLLQRSLPRAKSYGLAGLRTAIESLGSFASAITFRSEFKPGQLHDGARGYRLFRYDAGCECFAYSTPLRVRS